MHAVAVLMLSPAPPIEAQVRVGAARIDITPGPDLSREPFTSIHNPILTRAISIENGSASALLVDLNPGKISQGCMTLWRRIVGEETLRILDGISHFSSTVVIQGSSSVVSFLAADGLAITVKAPPAPTETSRRLR